MLFADIAINTETGVFLGTVGLLALAAIKFLFNNLMGNLKEQVANYKKLAEEGAVALWNYANEKRVAEGKPPLVAVEPVLAQHQSPVTKDQTATADFHTILATQVAATKALGFPPVQPGRAEEKS